MSAPFASHIDEAHSDHDQYYSYKAISALAVVSLGLGVLSVLMFLEWIFGAIALLGILVGIAARRQIRLRQHELTGLSLAGLGVILSAAMLLSGAAWHIYVYQTEVPEGYTRINYDKLQPTPENPNILPPPDALELDGQQVFIKGYMYPSRSSLVKEFVLCRDNKECCFGGQPKPWDMILVTMKDSQKAEYSAWQRKVAGTLRIKPAVRDAEEGVVHQIVYQMEASFLP